jgi:hypothetical protein
VRQLCDDEGETFDSLSGHARLNLSGRTVESTNYSGKKVGYVLLVLALILPWLVANRFRSYRLHEQEFLVRSNLKLIQIALQEYFVEHKSLPFSPQGPDYALYKLKPYIGAECFEGDTKNLQEARAFWEDDEKRLRNSDFYYLNEPSVRPDFARFILMSRPGLTGEWAYLATGFGITGHKAKGADLTLLGSCQTPDLFLIANFGLYQEWLRTHPDSIAQSGGHVGMTPAGASISLDYRYEGDRLRKCFVRTDKGVIEETVELDYLGRIAKLSRQPDHWESLLGD